MQNEPELVEIAAKVLAPHMEGGREFDQMPPDRIALRKWCREGMCSTNDATQDDALEAATAALAAVTPQIEARVVGEIAKRFDHIRSDLNNISRAIEDEGDRAYFGSTNDADELRQIAQKFEDWLLARERGDHEESQP